MSIGSDVEAVRITVKDQGGLSWRGGGHKADEVVDAREEQTAGGGLAGTYAGPQPSTQLHLCFDPVGDDEEYTLT
ncbi:hypothetical protein [Streptomyces sp. NPDC053427]|uniref:hypothetical protein n=1 Tax=Streptomyces sp. NPDC053427 TaxID=3365701 RepID=UPI0037D330F5